MWSRVTRNNNAIGRGAAAAAAALGVAVSRDTARADADKSSAPVSRPRMIVRDPDEFARKWKKFSTEGIEKLVVIADFDHTLTTFRKPNGDHGDSSHGILMKTAALDPEVKRIGVDLFNQYYPIEQSTKLSNAEKLPFLVEWWTKEHDTLVEYKLTKDTIRSAVDESDVAFRRGFFEIFDVLAAEDVPTLIFSAGLYDVIHAVLDKEYAKTPTKVLPSNVHVIANMMTFDESETITGFEGKQLIHSLNKNASVVKDTPFWQRCQLQQRENILLLGDSLGDANMAEGLDVHDDNIVRVGFLNHHLASS
ncbi:hypothetical protein P43SY_000587 [Pythium insidiosum]|uniref:5'-nucleotidase n=1 Tax=Pythium insidiosum TaxID=114742 RepID=A0AAD5L8K7_PYTIN|nr:hypothetical protein P43SY_000587 [Pythium insidiosum]